MNTNEENLKTLSPHDKALLKKIIERFKEEDGAPPEQIIIDFSEEPEK